MTFSEDRAKALPRRVRRCYAAMRPLEARHRACSSANRRYADLSESISPEYKCLGCLLAPRWLEDAQPCRKGTEREQAGVVIQLERAPVASRPRSARGRPYLIGGCGL